MSAAVHVLVLADGLASCQLDPEVRPFPPYSIQWRNLHCAPVRDQDASFSPEPFLVPRLTIAALCVVAGHSISTSAPAQPLLETSFCLDADVQAALCIATLVADVILHEFHAEVSVFLGMSGPMAPAASLPSSLQW